MTSAMKFNLAQGYTSFTQQMGVFKRSATYKGFEAYPSYFYFL